jgi:hypothetical protein
MNWTKDLETKRCEEERELQVDDRLGTFVSAVATGHLS